MKTMNHEGVTGVVMMMVVMTILHNHDKSAEARTNKPPRTNRFRGPTNSKDMFYRLDFFMEEFDVAHIHS